MSKALYYFLNLPMSKMNIRIQEFYNFMKLRHIVRGFSF